MSIERDCDSCDGEGIVGCGACSGSGIGRWGDPDTSVCSICHGRGVVPCDECDGDGTFEKESLRAELTAETINDEIRCQRAWRCDS